MSCSVWLASISSSSSSSSSSLSAWAALFVLKGVCPAATPPAANFFRGGLSLANTGLKFNPDFAFQGEFLWSPPHRAAVDQVPHAV